MNHHSLPTSRGAGAEVSTQTPDDKLAEVCLATLRRLDSEVSCISLGRLCHADSSAIFRILSAHPDVIAKRGVGFTMFRVRK